MKIIVCDVCGKSVPSDENKEIEPVSIAYGILGPIVYLEKDICKTCLDTFLNFFRVRTVALEVIKPELEPIPEEEHPMSVNPEDIKETTVNVDLADGKIVKEQAADGALILKRKDTGKPLKGVVEQILCVQCGELFTPLRTNSRFCGKACDQKWHYRQRQKDKIKKGLESTEGVDDILKRLKRENPIHEIPEPKLNREL